MPSDNPTSKPTPTPPPAPPTEDLDPSQTVFFKRRKQRINLLPIAVVSALVLGSGALITWAVSQSGKKGPASAEPAEVRPETRKILTPAEARELENPVIHSTKTAPSTDNAPKAMAVASTPAPFDPSKPVRAAAPVNGSMPPAAVPVATAVAADGVEPLNLDITNADNAKTKEEVLRRIDLMPGVSASNKDKLYASVDHARAMGRVLKIPFEKGESAVHGADIDRLKTQVQNPEIKKLVDDPTVVFVILGYADPKGSEKINNDVSLARARSVMETLRDKCGFQNIMHPVAMGGSTLFGSQEIEQNRAVEIWAVLP